MPYMYMYVCMLICIDIHVDAAPEIANHFHSQVQCRWYNECLESMLDSLVFTFLNLPCHA